MNAVTSPQSWQAPDWHPDFGAAPEFNQLKAFGVALLDAARDFVIQFHAPEPGLMYVQVQSSSGAIAEVYSAEISRNSSERQLAIFVFPDTNREAEIQTDSIDDAVIRTVQFLSY